MRNPDSKVQMLWKYCQETYIGPDIPRKHNHVNCWKDMTLQLRDSSCDYDYF